MVDAMKIKEGYKLTEVGVIPSDWEVNKIDDVAIKVGSGITPTGGERVYKKEGRPFLRSQNVGWGSLILDDIAFIDDTTHSAFNSTEIQENDVFLNITGASIGRSAIANKRIVGGNVNQHVCIIRGDKNKIESKYLNYFLLSYLGQNQINDFQAGGNRQGLNFGQIKSIQIPLPPTKAEQTAIATALNDADALITQLEKLIAKKRNIKQGAMQELLKPKEGWDVKKLGDCLRHNPDYGINAAATLYRDSLPVYLRITDITEDGKYSKKNVVSVDSISSSDYFLEKGDLVFARTGASVGKTYLYNTKDGRLVFAGFLIRIKTNPEVLIPEYFQFYTQTSLYWDWVRTNSMRTGQPGINGNEYKELIITLPSKTEQTAIAQILSDMDAEIEALERKLEKYRMIKQGMMQNLLTGKIRLI